MRSVYFDYNATTPLAPEVREAMLPFWGEIFGNPSSLHHVGRKARSLLDEARERVAQVWTCKPSEVVFTSGGTESNNLAIFGAARLLKAKGRHLVTSAVEHHAVLHCFDYLQKREGFEVTVVPVDAEGRVSLESVAAAVRGDTVLVSVMSANNEIGTLEPVQDIGAFCRERGIIFHTDAVQSFGKEAFISMHQFNADLVSACAHKFHGPKGAGALFVRSPLHPDPILFGGGHENERRAGTENVAAIVGFAEATERFVREPIFPRAKLLSLTEKLESQLKALAALGVAVRSPGKDRLSNTVAFTVRGCDSISLLAGLDLEGVCASSGSACSAGSLEPSHVMVAIGVEKSSANALVRFSLGKDSTDEEVEHVAKVVPEVIQRAQQFQ
jgi:cysteine desulfurase